MQSNSFGAERMLSIFEALKALFEAVEAGFAAKSKTVEEQATTDVISSKKSLKKACDIVPDIFLISAKIFKLYQNSLLLYEKYFEPKPLEKRLLRSVRKALRKNKQASDRLQKAFEKCYKTFEKLD